MFSDLKFLLLFLLSVNLAQGFWFTKSGQPSSALTAENSVLVETQDNTTPESLCLSSGCPLNAIGNGVCDEECNIAACNFDMGECSSQGDKPGAQDWAQIGSGAAAGSGGQNQDLGWNAEEPSNSEQACLDSGCPSISLMGNSECNDLCNSAACNYDMGDCAPTVVATEEKNSIFSYLDYDSFQNQGSKPVHRSPQRRLLDMSHESSIGEEVLRKLRAARRTHKQNVRKATSAEIWRASW